MVSVRDLQDVVDDLKEEATKRASDLLGDSKSEVRRAVGGHTGAELFGTLALGLVLGAIVGAALALLFAPFTGDEARRRITERVDRARTSDEMPMTNGSTRPVSTVGTPPYVSS
jgi:gas vesicle protein